MESNRYSCMPYLSGAQNDKEKNDDCSVALKIGDVRAFEFESVRADSR